MTDAESLGSAERLYWAAQAVLGWHIDHIELVNHGRIPDPVLEELRVACDEFSRDRSKKSETP